MPSKRIAVTYRSILDRPRWQKRRPGMALAPARYAFLEDEIGAVGQVVPNARKLGAGCVRMKPRSLNGLPKLLAQQYHLPDIEQVGAQHGRQHLMSLVNRFQPRSPADPVRNNFSERIYGWRNLGNAKSGSGAVPLSPIAKPEV